jgi:RNA polymerase sigma-70 factor (ECF subfamily)
MTAPLQAMPAPAVREPLEHVVERLRPRLEQLLARFRIPLADAEDLLQDTLLSTVRKWDEIQETEAWLLATLRNRCIVYWRRRRNTLHQAVDTALLEMLSRPVAAPQERAALVWDLNRALETLPRRCRTVLRLRYGLGLAPAEVAEEMGYLPDSVRKVSQRCLAALTHRLLALATGERLLTGIDRNS